MWLIIPLAIAGGLVAYKLLSSKAPSLAEAEDSARALEAQAFQLSNAGRMKEAADAARAAANSWRAVADLKAQYDRKGSVDALQRATGAESLAARWQPSR
jgi:hypothetical protein